MPDRIVLLIMALLISGLAVSQLSCASKNPSKKGANSLVKASKATISALQSTVLSVDGDRCFMVPSCSTYALNAIEKHGFFLGWVMACDRLLRCGHDEIYHGDVEIRRGELYCIDPVTNNDFWWNTP